MCNLYEAVCDSRLTQHRTGREEGGKSGVGGRSGCQHLISRRLLCELRKPCSCVNCSTLYTFLSTPPPPSHSLPSFPYIPSPSSFLISFPLPSPPSCSLSLLLLSSIPPPSLPFFSLLPSYSPTPYPPPCPSPSMATWSVSSGWWRRRGYPWL